MKSLPRHKKILYLMIVSQVLLLSLVVQWLRTQYREERETLLKELTSYYVQTLDEVVDTMLFKRYVSPVVSDKKIKIETHTSSRRDSSGITTMVYSYNTSNDEPPEVIEDQFEVESVIPVHDSLKKDSVRIRRISDDMILRSVKMIVSSSQDTYNISAPKKVTFIPGPDTSAFVMYFRNRLSDAGLKFNISWFKNPDTVPRKPFVQTMVIGPGSPFGLPEASVSDFRGYLLRRILPQILFGLLLVLLTGLAFRLSYFSIREHMILGDIRNEFISNITHELKTPIATLSVALESLGKYGMKNDPAVTDEYIRLASLETKRLEALVNRVLTQSVLEQNESMLNRELFDINTIIREVVDIMKQRLETAGSIEFLPDEKTLTLNGDPLFLKGVLVNLIDNSIKYCDKAPAIKVLSGKEEGFAVIKVNDNGPGIPSEYHKKIFEKFFRIPTGNIHNVKGYGLGLSFASLVVHLHNGKIRVRNLDNGCSFIIHLPLA